MKEYDVLKKKYGLPTLEVIKKEWDIPKLDPELPVLFQIKQKMREKIENVAIFMEKLIQPDPNSLVDLYEYRCFKNSQKSEIFELFKHVMVFHRKMIEIELSVDEKKEAEIIKRVTAEWPQVRDALKPFVAQLTECWQKPSKKKGELRYFG